MKAARRRLLAAAAAAGVLAAACAASPTPTRSAAEVTHDAGLEAQVKAAIASEAGARTAFLIDVDAHRGVVTLNGLVDTEADRSLAAAAAAQVEGVREVKNGLRLKRR